MILVLSIAGGYDYIVMKNVTRVLSTILILAALASCSTTPPAQRLSRVEKLLEELQTADVDRLMELSAKPFLLDGEVLAREADIRSMWTNLGAAGFHFNDAVITDVAPASGPDQYESFAATMDVRVFFERHLFDGAGLIEVRTEYGSFLILTGDKVSGIPQIAGFTGPR